MLPPYFESYKPFLGKNTTPYFRRPHPILLPPTSHIYAESGIICQFVHMNIISVNNKLIMQKIIERIHSLAGFSKYVTKMMKNTNMSVPKEFVVHVVGYEYYIYECTHIICCMRWSSSNSMR